MQAGRILALICFYCAPFIAIAQTEDALELQAHKVMIIPFNPYNYLSDADLELAKINNTSPEDISVMFRYGLNYDLSTRIISRDSYDILSDTTVDSQKDLFLIYSSIHYEFAKPLDAFAKDSATDKTIHQPDLFGNGGDEPEEEKNKLFDKKESVESTGDKKYLNAIITHPEIFSNLQTKYGTDLFLFINQFELITNYAHCLDRSKNYFERKVVVHYSIYNADGKQLKGDAVEVTFSSSETNIDEIIAEKFPVISELLSQSLQPASNGKK